MTATEELRRLLDERGVEYSREGCETFFKNYHIWAIDKKRLCLSMTNLTPEQAVAATLGPGTCRNNAPTYLDFLCSECGFVHYHSDANDTKDGNGWGYCPNCGARVVEVGE